MKKSSTRRKSVIVETVWGTHEINNKVLEELIHSPIMTRIKNINQGGPTEYLGLDFSRYDHSIGVLVLLQKANVSLKEQVAGLLHDASHTAFSHIGDHLFYKPHQEHSYQDKVHLSFLKHMHVLDIVQKFGININELNPDLPEYKALEQPLPNLCADRIEYTLHTSFVHKTLSLQTIVEIVTDLNFKDDAWFFCHIRNAQLLAEASLHFIQYLWGSERSQALNCYFTEMLKHAIELNLITKDDMHFGTDQLVMNKLTNSNDDLIKKYISICNNILHHFKTVKFGSGDWNIRPKFVGVDPLIKVGDKYERLSKLDSKFKQNFEAVKSWCQQGYGIKKLN